LASLIGDGSAQNSGERHDGVEDTLGRQNAARPAPPLMRRTFGPVPGRGERQSGSSGGALWRGSGHGVTSCAALGRGQVGWASRWRRSPATPNQFPSGNGVNLSTQQVRREGGGSRATGGFASRHGHTSFSKCPGQGFACQGTVSILHCNPPFSDRPLPGTVDPWT
jgi:hypothetical protein